jgi:RNA polymerase sigma-70 factor (sigma-E family)
MASAPSSFDDFVRSHVDDLVRMAYLITWDPSESEDLVQECLIRVAKHWSRVSGMAMPLAYARRTLANLAFDGRKHRSRRHDELSAPEPGDIADPSTNSTPETVGIRSEMAAALGQLTRQQRTVLGLRYFLDLSESQVAAILDCSEGNVKSTASRALARVRELIVSPPPEAEVCDK